MRSAPAPSSARPPTQSWRGALAQRLDAYLDQSADALAASVEAQVRAALLGQEQDA
jgi:hypothetical protein